MINELNNNFGIDRTLKFIKGPGGFPQIYISNNFATAIISLYGAQILSFRPLHQEDLLWVSEKSLYQSGKAIRGGIPICWPWFGAHPSAPDKQSHGFARLSDWSVIKTETLTDGATEINLELKDSEDTKKQWPHNFRATVAITISDKLDIALTTHNTGNEQLSITAALHTYFNISHINQISIHGLENIVFLDSLTNTKDHEEAPIIIDREIDRIYLDHSGSCHIKDCGLKRTIKINKQGSNSTVVWNPWIEKSSSMTDFGNEEYKTMLCVETTNANIDTRKIMPGASHTLSATISSV
jgi:D-hexose-6-phosphate mutarotase